MDKNELEDNLDQADDQAFYRDTFGEKITNDSQDDMMPAENDEEMVADETDAEMDMDQDSETADDNSFRESLDNSETGEPSSMDDPGSDFEDSRASSENQSMSDKLRDKYNDLTGNNKP